MSSLSYHLFVLCWLFNVSFLRYSSTNIGLAFMCFFILEFVHPVFVTLYSVTSSPVVFCSMHHCGSMHPQSPVFPMLLWQLILQVEKIYDCGYLHLCLPGVVFYWSSMLSFIIITYYGCLLNTVSISVDSLLDRSVARFSCPGLISVDFICNKDISMCALVSMVYFHVSFYKCYACLCFSIALMIIAKLYCVMYAKLLWASLKQSLCPCLKLFWWAAHTLKKIILYVFIRLSALNYSTCFMTRNLLW